MFVTPVTAMHRSVTRTESGLTNERDPSLVRLGRIVCHSLPESVYLDRARVEVDRVRRGHAEVGALQTTSPLMALATAEP